MNQPKMLEVINDVKYYFTKSWQSQHINNMPDNVRFRKPWRRNIKDYISYYLY